MHAEYSIDQLCGTLNVTRSGYHAWASRAPGVRAQANAALLPLITLALFQFGGLVSGDCVSQDQHRQKMKAKTNTVHILIALLAYWFGLCNASAFYDPGAQRWLNRDPMWERGFVNLQASARERRWLPFQTSPEVYVFANFYSFVRNNPLEFFDVFGLAPVLSPTEPPPSPPNSSGGGGGGDPCVFWAQQAAAAAAYLTEFPYDINQQIKLAEAVANFKALGCDKPNIPPEDPCPSSKPPWYKRVGSGLLDILDRLGRIPIFIFDPCGPLGDPTLCPGHGPVMA